MTNREKYNQAFKHIFTVEDTVLNEDFSILNIEKWDSVAHMGLISELEEAFDIMFDTDDIINFTSYICGIDLLKKYGIEL